MRRAGGVLAAAVLCALAGASPSRAAECPGSDSLVVVGAERQEQACLDDLTTAGTRESGHTDPGDWAGLAPRAQRNPSGVPGLQIDGYMPDTSKTNTTHGWNHDSQFVIRLPNEWNGKLIVTGAPGTRKQYASDPIIADWVLSKGYAYAGTDKGNGGVAFYNDGTEPGDAGVEWNHRVTEIAIAAKDVVRQRYGRVPDRTYVTGISQGGYLTRWQLENRPDLYDGGVDWEGTLWYSPGPNPFTYIPVALRNYPRYRATGDEAAHDAMIAAGFAPGSEFLWEDHYAVYWDLTQRTYREEFDPAYDGQLAAGVPFCQPGMPMCDADYDWAGRPPEAHQALARIDNTGRIGKPMITLHGTLDSLLPIATNGDPYRRLVEQAGRARLHRYWVIENGNHVDGRFDVFPSRLRPLQPCWRQALDALEQWVEHGKQPPRDQFVPDDRTGDLANECTIPQGPLVPDVGPLPQPGASVTRKAPKRLRVRIARLSRSPQSYVVRGRIVLPGGTRPKQACGAGVVAVTVREGRRSVGAARGKLRSTCRFRVPVRVRNASRGTLRFTVRFQGNRALKRATTRRTVKLKRR